MTDAFHRCTPPDGEGRTCVDLRTVKAQRVDNEQFAGQTFVLGLIEDSHMQVPPLLEGLDVGMALNAMKVFGGHALRSELGGDRWWSEFGASPELHYFDDATTPGAEIALTVGFRILQGNVESLRNTFAEWRHRAGDKALSGLAGLLVMEAHQEGKTTTLSGEIARGIPAR